MTHILIFIHWFVLVFTFGNVELVTIDNSKSNDLPIEELNNYTLREVFEGGNLVVNGDFSNGTIGFIGQGLTIANVSNNQVMTIIPSSTVSSRLETSSNLLTITNNKYMIITRVKTSVNTQVRLRVASVNLTTVNTVANEYFYISHIITAGLQEPLRIYPNNTGVMVENETAIVDYIYTIDLTTLGIDTLTVQQMDDWFNVYQENSEREISETYDYVENELTTNDLIYIVLFALLWGLGFRIVKELL